MKRKDIMPINKEIPQVLKLHNITLDGDRPEFFYLKFAKKPNKALNGTFYVFDG